MAGEGQEEGMEEEARVAVEKVEVARAAAREAAARAAVTEAEGTAAAAKEAAKEAAVALWMRRINAFARDMCAWPGGDRESHPLMKLVAMSEEAERDEMARRGLSPLKIKFSQLMQELCSVIQADLDQGSQAVAPWLVTLTDGRFGEPPMPLPQSEAAPAAELEQAAPETQLATPALS